MEKNVGSVDRVIRLILGIVLVVLGINFVENWWGIAMIVVGAVLFGTGLMNRCALYAPFGISTAKSSGQSEGEGN